MPDLRHGARADGRAARARAWRQRGARRFHPQALDRRAAVARARRARHGLACVRRRSPAFPLAAGRAMAEARPRHARGVVVRLAVLRARLCLAALGLAEHVHADRARHRRGLSLQPGRDARAGAVPGSHAGCARADPHLFRGGGGHRRAGAARPGARAQGPREDRRRHSRAARPCAQDRSARAEGRQDRDGGACLGQGRRCLARAARRQGPDRRHRHRGTQRRR